MIWDFQAIFSQSLNILSILPKEQEHEAAEGKVFILADT